MMGIGENGRVWKQREGGELVEMTENLYDSEDLLQGMLARVRPNDPRRRI